MNKQVLSFFIDDKDATSKKELISITILQNLQK